MAEAVVTFVLEKIGEAAYQEALALYGAEDKVAWAKHELEWVSAFLKDADAKAKQNLDNRVKQWVKNVKEVAYLIEDALDKFLVEVGGGPEKLGALKKIRNMPKILVARHRVSKEIDDIKERVREIRESAVNYGIEKLSDNCSGNVTVNKPLRLPVLPDIDETEVLGFESDMNKIVEQLTKNINLSRSVVSIVGTGGLGKTTLAKLVYKSAAVKDHFGHRMWITISRDYDLMDILKKMLKQIYGARVDMQGLDAGDLVQKIHSFLLEKTYLVVLDDVWSTDLWAELQKVLPEVKNGSRALITTRSKDVAQDANKSATPYELQVLNGEKSLELMLSKAFPNQFANECADDLLHLAKQFAKRCGGLPLALIVMGRLLSKKHPDLNTWSELLGKIKWHTDGKECMKIVSTSYEELPPHLKLCFMYFAIFPEDCEIKASLLLRLWIAEGFIPQEETMEDTAENYLEELAQRCMVQITQRSYRGAIKSCRVHDILHELAICKAQEDNFAIVQSNSVNNPSFSSGSSARRISLHDGPTVSNRRCLTYVGDSTPNFNELRMARVINLQHTMSYPYVFDLRCLEHLTTLRYLRIHHQSVDTTILSFLAPWKFLQTFDPSICTIQMMDKWDNRNNCYGHMPCLYSRKNTDKQELHHSFWNNRMLRHFLWPWNNNLEVMGPPSSAHLENLLTLKCVYARDEWSVKLPHFPRIRKLGIRIRPDFGWEKMTQLMSELEHLESLSLRADNNEPMKDPCITSAFKNFKNMYKLYLDCIWSEDAVIDSCMFPPHLVNLTLRRSEIRQDPMPELGKLPCLKILVLEYKSYVGEQMICSTGNFKCLQYFRIEGLPTLKEIKIENGTMPILNELCMAHISEMEIVPDFQILTKLRDLTHFAMSNKFSARLRGEDQHKVQHMSINKNKYTCTIM